MWHSVDSIDNRIFCTFFKYHYAHNHWCCLVLTALRREKLRNNGKNKTIRSFFWKKIIIIARYGVECFSVHNRSFLPVAATNGSRHLSTNKGSKRIFECVRMKMEFSFWMQNGNNFMKLRFFSHYTKNNLRLNFDSFVRYSKIQKKYLISIPAHSNMYKLYVYLWPARSALFTHTRANVQFMVAIIVRFQLPTQRNECGVNYVR